VVLVPVEIQKRLPAYHKSWVLGIFFYQFGIKIKDNGKGSGHPQMCTGQNRAISWISLASKSEGIGYKRNNF
jgi:hypothetical protein